MNMFTKIDRYEQTEIVINRMIVTWFGFMAYQSL